MGLAAARDDLLPLVPWVKKYLPHYVPLDPSDFHRELASDLFEMIETRGTKLLAIAPRDSAKSTWISTAYPIYCICNGLEPYILMAAETTEQAEKYVSTIRREFETNERIALDYPAVFGRGPAWGARGLTFRTGQRIEGVGAGKSVRGRRQAENRPTLIIVDDPEDQDSLWSEPTRKRRFSWLMNAVLKAASPESNVLVVGTMIHEDCTVAKLVKMPGWKGRKVWSSIQRFPSNMELWDSWEVLYHKDEAEADRFYNDNKVAMNDGAKVLWPARLSLLDLMKERSQDRSSFARERQNEPLPPEGSRFDAEWFGDEIWWDSIPSRASCFAMVDPATGKNKKQGDYSAIVWAWWEDGDPFLYVDALLRKTNVNHTNEAFVEVHMMNNFRVAGYESIAFQEVGRQDLIHKTAAAGVSVPIVPVYQSENKFLRIDRLGPLLQQGKLRFKRGSEGAALLVQQLRRYSYPSTDKLDGPDALESLVRLIGAFVRSANNPGGIRLSDLRITT